MRTARVIVGVDIGVQRLQFGGMLGGVRSVEQLEGHLGHDCDSGMLKTTTARPADVPGPPAQDAPAVARSGSDTALICSAS